MIAVDQHSSRLDTARAQGAEVVDFSSEDPIEAIRELTAGIGPDRVIDAVGVDAQRPHSGPAADASETSPEEFAEEVEATAPETDPDGDRWVPGDAPSLALRWAVRSVAKAGTISMIGVYAPEVQAFPIGEAFNKNLTIRGGNCNHRRYIPYLVRLTRSGAIDPSTVLTQVEGMTDALAAYEAFDKRAPGWMKVELEPAT